MKKVYDTVLQRMQAAGTDTTGIDRTISGVEAKLEGIKHSDAPEMQRWSAMGTAPRLHQKSEQVRCTRRNLAHTAVCSRPDVRMLTLAR